MRGGGRWGEQATHERLLAACCDTNAQGFDLEAHVRGAAVVAVEARARARAQGVKGRRRRTLARVRPA